MEINCFNKIAQDYHLKRKNPWKPLERFLTELNERGYHFKGVCVDLGCGNGRNFQLLQNTHNHVLGIDNSIEFLKIAKKNREDPNPSLIKHPKFIHLILGDIHFLPLRENKIQNFFSIASFHHINDAKQRKKATRQIYQLIKPNGFFLITVWRRWQKKFKWYFCTERIKRIFNPLYRKKQSLAGIHEFGDKLIPWTVSWNKIKYIRFYHLFSKREIKRIIERHFNIRQFNTLGGASGKDNFFILAQKVI